MYVSLFTVNILQLVILLLTPEHFITVVFFQLIPTESFSSVPPYSQRTAHILTELTTDQKEHAREILSTLQQSCGTPLPPPWRRSLPAPNHGQAAV